MTDPILETPRLRIVPFGEDHLGARYVAWLNDPAVVRFSENRHQTHTLQSCRDYMTDMQNGPHFFWAIEQKSAAKRHIGNITAYIDAPNGVADVAIMIGDTRVHGLGLGGEAWCAVVDYLIDTAGMRRVQAGTMADNQPMRALMRKSGMQEEGRQAERFLLDGQPVDLVFGARLADQNPNQALT